MKAYLFFLLFLFAVGCSNKTESPVVKTVSEASTSVSEGEKIVKANCKVCHASGINGAPILGNQMQWSKRAGQGEAVLVEHVISGYGLMPAKGGKEHLSDEEIALAVRYMLSLVGK